VTWGRSPPCEGRSEESSGGGRSLSGRRRGAAPGCACLRFEGGRFGGGSGWRSRRFGRIRGPSHRRRGLSVQVGRCGAGGRGSGFGVVSGSVGSARAPASGRGRGGSCAPDSDRACCTRSGSSRVEHFGAASRTSTAGAPGTPTAPRGKGLRVQSMYCRAMAVRTGCGTRSGARRGGDQPGGGEPKTLCLRGSPAVGPGDDCRFAGLGLSPQPVETRSSGTMSSSPSQSTGKD